MRSLLSVASPKIIMTCVMVVGVMMILLVCRSPAASDATNVQVTAERIISSGRGHVIFHPSGLQATAQPILQAPEVILRSLVQKYTHLDHIVHPLPDTVLNRARSAYISMLKAFITGAVYGDSERAVEFLHRSNETRYHTHAMNTTSRTNGEEWPYLGDSMVGSKRLDSLQAILLRVFADRIPGDFLEAGVWRGGTSVLARGVMRAYGEDRKVFAADSFAGLPAGNTSIDPMDKGWDGLTYLQASTAIVAETFQTYSLLDDKVVFAKGLFQHTMPALRSIISKLAVLRIDGDMYESTADVLYNMYDKLSVGGVVIQDDWTGFPSRTACEDFFAVHHLQPAVIAIDNLSVYWVKTEEVVIEYWRYQQKQFKPI